MKFLVTGSADLVGIQIIKEYFAKNKIEYNEVYSVNGSIFSKIVNLVYLLDCASIYSAVMSKIDPCQSSQLIL